MWHVPAKRLQSCGLTMLFGSRMLGETSARQRPLRDPRPDVVRRSHRATVCSSCFSRRYRRWQRHCGRRASWHKLWRCWRPLQDVGGGTCLHAVACACLCTGRCRFVVLALAHSPVEAHMCTIFCHASCCFNIGASDENLWGKRKANTRAPLCTDANGSLCSAMHARPCRSA